MTGLHDDKCAKQLLTLFVYNSLDCLHQSLASIARKADQDHTSRVHMTDKHQPAEVLVFGQQDAPLTARTS